MLIIRLLKTGKKNSPAFRLVLTEKTAGPKSGQFLEVLGNYNSRVFTKDAKGKKNKEVSLKEDRIKYWLSQGVKTSDTVHNLLVSAGIIDAPKIQKKITAKKGGDESASTEVKKEGEKEEENSQVDNKADDEKPKENEESTSE